MPGISVRPARSTTRSSGRVCPTWPVPTEVMRSASTTTVTPGLAGCSPSTRLAFVNTVRAMGQPPVASRRSCHKRGTRASGSAAGAEDGVPVGHDELLDPGLDLGHRNRALIGAGHELAELRE